MATKRSSTLMRALAASTAATLAFAPLAQAADVVSHPFMAKTPEASDVRGLYTNGIIKAASSVAKDRTEGSLRAGMYATMLEANLSVMKNKLSEAYFSAPKDSVESMFQLHGMSPTSQFMGGHATMCAEQNGKVLGAWKIYLSPMDYYGADGKLSAHFNAGQVVPRSVVPNTSAQSAREGSYACLGTIVAAAQEIKVDHALQYPGK